MNKEQLNQYILQTLSEEEAQKLVEQMRADILCKEIANNATARRKAERLQQLAISLLDLPHSESA